MRPLPSRRLEAVKRLEVTVTSSSVIHVQNNTYSVNSRLIGARVRLYYCARVLLQARKRTVN